MTAYDEKFREYLKLRGLRLTPERVKILNEVFSIHKHFEADDLLVRFRQRESRVSRASIFRTLKLLVSSGLLRKIIIGENRSYYEHVFGHGHHDHLICSRCGKIIEFSDQKIERLQDGLCNEYNFKPTEHTLKISGYCRECQKGVKMKEKEESIIGNAR